MKNKILLIANIICIALIAQHIGWRIGTKAEMERCTLKIEEVFKE